MPRGKACPPRGNLIRAQLDDAAVAERADGLRKEPAQLGDRPWLRLVLREVLRDELAQRDLREPPVPATQPLELDLQRLQRLGLRRERAHLRPRRATTVDAIAVRPRRLAIRAARLQLEHLSLLRHHRLLSRLDLQSQGHRVAAGRAPKRIHTLLAMTALPAER